jgi:TolB-like protein
VHRTSLLLLGLASLLPAARLSAQCPDGSAPPCTRAGVRVAPAANSVAVLYFAARDTADAYLADGLTEDVTSLLGSVTGVQVQSPGMARRAQRATPDNLLAVARTLGVRYLVDGSVRRIGTRVRVSARLVSGANAVALWGDVFDRTPDELLALPSVIAREVAARVGGAAAAPISTFRTRSPAAYDHYLRGNFFLAQRSAQATAQALQEYREAERLDSGFTAAVGRGAYAHAIARFLNVPLAGVPVESLAIRGLAVADRALRRDSGSSEAWMARGALLSFAHPLTLEGATDAFDRAIALDPRNAEAHHQYAAVLNFLGRHGDADRELHLALALDPGRAISYSDLAVTHGRDTALAVALADSAVALDPTSPTLRRVRARARLVAGDIHGALDDAELANRILPRNPIVENVLAMVLARAGDTAQARTLIGHWMGRTAHWSVFAAQVAIGDTAAALDGLEAARTDPGYWMVLQFPEFDALHGNPRYEQLLVRLRPPGAVGP